jgi:ABC-type molybdate transport system substrate-binding protein
LAITAGVSANASSPAAAAAFARFLRTPAAMKIIEATGMAPIEK